MNVPTVRTCEDKHERRVENVTIPSETVRPSRMDLSLDSYGKREGPGGIEYFMKQCVVVRWRHSSCHFSQQGQNRPFFITVISMIQSKSWAAQGCV